MGDITKEEQILLIPEWIGCLVCNAFLLLLELTHFVKSAIWACTITRQRQNGNVIQFQSFDHLPYKWKYLLSCTSKVAYRTFYYG